MSLSPEISGCEAGIGGLRCPQPVGNARGGSRQPSASISLGRHFSLVIGGRKPVWVRHSSAEWLSADVALGHLASVQVRRRVVTAVYHVHAVIFAALLRTRYRRHKSAPRLPTR
jgi:hypothetical protein